MRDRAIKGGRRKPDVEPALEIVEAPAVSGYEQFVNETLGAVAAVVGIPSDVLSSELKDAPDVPEHIPNRFYGID